LLAPFIVPRFLSLVEIRKEKHFNQEKYFYAGEFLVIRLVLYKPARISINDFIRVSLELYLLPQ